jgi:hypothetical protein
MISFLSRLIRFTLNQYTSNVFCIRFHRLLKENFKCLDFNPCANSPCLNGATCQVSGSSYTCQCAPGYSGSNCQIC